MPHEDLDQSPLIHGPVCTYAADLSHQVHGKPLLPIEMWTFLI